jgi:hypothetical protein
MEEDWRIGPSKRCQAALKKLYSLPAKKVNVRRSEMPQNLTVMLELLNTSLQVQDGNEGQCASGALLNLYLGKNL